MTGLLAPGGWLLGLFWRHNRPGGPPAPGRVDLDELLEHADALLVFAGGRVSRLIPRAQLDAQRLARLIGGSGFAEVG